MNAKTLERIILFRSNHGLVIIKEIIYRKIFYQFSVVNKKDEIIFYKDKLDKTKEVKDIFIIEALAARKYWHYFCSKVVDKCEWSGRLPHNDDPMNKLLDIGYHYLIGLVAGIFDEMQLPYELGILHKAQSQKAKPLVYDYIEWLRPIVVDHTLLVFIRKKKNKFDTVSSKDIAIFINRIKKKLNTLYFHKKLGYCISLEYWIKLNALNLLSAINHNKKPDFIFPSLRHESRCKNKKPPKAGVLKKRN